MSAVCDGTMMCHKQRLTWKCFSAQLSTGPAMGDKSHLGPPDLCHGRESHLTPAFPAFPAHQLKERNVEF